MGPALAVSAQRKGLLTPAWLEHGPTRGQEVCAPKGREESPQYLANSFNAEELSDSFKSV